MAIKKPKYNFSLICDDIREEKGNKLSFIGVYAQDIFVPKLPFVFAKLCFFIAYDSVQGGIVYNCQLLDADSKKIGKNLKISIPDEAPKGSKFNIIQVFSPLRVEKEGNYQLSISFEYNKKIIVTNDINFKVSDASKVKDSSS